MTETFYFSFGRHLLNLQWQRKRIKIDGSYLNNLRLADDLLLIAANTDELKEMLEQLM